MPPCPRPWPPRCARTSRTSSSFSRRAAPGRSACALRGLMDVSSNPILDPAPPALTNRPAKGEGSRSTQAPADRSPQAEETPATLPAPESEVFVDRFNRSTGRTADTLFRLATGACAAAVAALILVAIAFLVHGSIPAFRDHGFGAVTSPVWDPTNQKYGALSFLFGTAYTSLIGMAIALPLGVLTAVALVEILPRPVASAISLAVEMLAAIPSVLLGLWGIFVLGAAGAPGRDLHLQVAPWLEQAAPLRRRPPGGGFPGGRPAAGDHGPALHPVGDPGGDPAGARRPAGGGLRPGRHPLADDPPLHPAIRLEGHLRRRPAGPGPGCSGRPWR